MKNRIPLLIVLVLALSLATAIATIDYNINQTIDAELTVDFSYSEGEIKHGATGFLYGIAEQDAPNGNLLYALSPQVLSTKVPNGLQHPSGDIAHVESTFFDNGGKNAIIYMQDIYPDWYYAYRKDYLDTMSNVLDDLVALEHSDKFIYQPFNEMNNGVWYGDFSLIDNRYKFYDAYKDAYLLIKEKTNGAPVGGPAYTDYNHDYVKEFLEYCVANDCVPDVMIWHELVWYSTYGIRYNVADYRKIEKELGISERRIIIDEYGTFKDIGTPGNLIQYIASFEATKTEGCLAFWRLPNNLNDLASSQNTPTSAWWLYHWYSQMTGDTYKTTKSEETIPYFSAVATLDTEKATIICGGAEGKTKINLAGLSTTQLFKNANSIQYEIEYLDFEGLTTASTGGKTLLSGVAPLHNGTAKIEINQASFSRAYRINVYPCQSTITASTYTLNKNLPIRYEAETFETNASLVTCDDIRYASSGGGVKLTNGSYASCTISIDKDGLYAVEMVYASNPMIGAIRLNPRVILEIDGTIETTTLPNTLTDMSSGEYKFYHYFNNGEHTIKIKEDYGDVTIDFIDVERVADGYSDIEHKYDGIKLNGKNEELREFILVTEKSGYYELESDGKILKINSNELIQSNKYYLQKGINIIEASLDTNSVNATQIISTINTYSIEIAENASGYIVKNEYATTGYYILNTPSNYKISFNVEVNSSGYYALTTLYSNAETNGTHPYNVKLVERYATISVNEKKVGIYYFSNTYSNFNFAEHTIFVYLEKGNNTITYHNDNSVIWNNLPNKLPNISAIQINQLSK